ncbi:MAG TPA: hypothetical protein VKH19_02165 [Gemmatimonadaceae bacterium]|nr:hypothetical protein [Gemmatimonadaceae bacterium]
MRSLLRSAVMIALLGACSRQVQVAGTTPPAAVREVAVTSADQLLDAMHDRYARTWYRNLVFVQQSTSLRADGTASRVETWYEAAALPGRLRIDLGEPSKGNGVLYRGDSVYQFQEGKLVDRRMGRNPLMILGFDVYAQPTSLTMQQLTAEHVDMRLLRTDTLYGRRVYVVGAAPGDSTSNQFWIDADRLVFVRLLQTDPARHATRDIRFENYVQHGGGWVAEEVKVYSRGALIFHEEYSNVRVDVPLDTGIFVPEKWRTAPHWYTP